MQFEGNMVDKKVNGRLEHREAPDVIASDMNAPVIHVSPISISLAQVRWAVLGLIGAIWSLYSAEYLYRPAKHSDVEAISRVVQTLDIAQRESREAISRLTVAVDNMSGILTRLPSPKNASKALRVK